MTDLAPTFKNLPFVQAAEPGRRSLARHTDHEIPAETRVIASKRPVK
jgi:hypothetical protein